MGLIGRKESRSPLARLVLFIVCLSVLGSVIAGALCIWGGKDVAPVPPKNSDVFLSGGTCKLSNGATGTVYCMVSTSSVEVPVVGTLDFKWLNNVLCWCSDSLGSGDSGV